MLDLINIRSDGRGIAAAVTFESSERLARRIAASRIRKADKRARKVAKRRGASA